jgi:SAM-dependent methyltransferase
MTLGDFTQQAASYKLARPSYPASLLDEIISDAAVAPGDSVADFGAGTGISTRLLVDRGFKVTALEPNEQMRQQADVTEAAWIDGTFEASHLPDASQDWAVAAQAFHWADPPRALPELRRILKPGRLFSVLWNNRAMDDSEILRMTAALIQKHAPGFEEAYRDRDWTSVLESTGDFRFLNHRTAPHVVPMSRERYLNLWRSHNRLNTIAGPDHFAAFMNDLVLELDRRRVTDIDVPYLCESWSARRVC